MTPTQEAIADFRGYLDEIGKGCGATRKAAIRKDAVTCQDLMNYSSDRCWERDDFRELDSIVGLVLTQTNDVKQI